MMRSYLRDLRRSRFFVPGLIAGVAIGATGGIAVNALVENAPRWTLSGSKAANPDPAPRAYRGGKLVLRPGDVIVVEGDSLTYGLARSPLAALGGSDELTRSDSPYPAVLERLLTHKVEVVNRGYVGDTTTDAIGRWRDASSGQLAVLMYGTNDAGIRGGQQLSLAAYEAQLEMLVRRRLYGGARVLLLMPPPVSARSGQTRLEPYRQAVSRVAQRTEVPLMDPAISVSGMPTGLQFDGTHMSQSANEALGRQIADQIVVDG